MDLKIRGKNAIITGGSHGIGLATAQMLASEGCNIAILSRNSQRLKEAKFQIEKYGVECLAISVDVLKRDQVENSFKNILDHWKTVHILVNNVGGGGTWGVDDFEKNPDNVWQEVYDKNVTAAILYTRFVLSMMKKQKWGRVITVSSSLGRQCGGRPWFNIAKTSQTVLMKNLSKDKSLVRKNITFNSVAPGCIMIPDTGWERERNKNPSKFDQAVSENFPMGRLGRPEEVAYAITMLCSESSSLINGTSLAVDGGESYAF
ncbi:MAG: hypothetical protein CMB80_08990 [Flammeovirgaceae bacterium]|nr:hypothetical protein [Flammeovirgaceae bacterium]|tara:strand:- start:930 stop:1712 length:783 start_codon:yes stop_codon:yes gene_type:complete